TLRSSPTSTMGRRRWSTACCARRGSSAPASRLPTGSSTPSRSSGSAASPSSRRTRPSSGTESTSTSSTRRATPTSVARSNGRAGTAVRDLAVPGTDLSPLFETIVAALPGPPHEPEAPTRFQANNLGYDDYVGRLAIGRVVAGELVAGAQYALCRLDGSVVP